MTWELPKEFPRLSGICGIDVETRDPLISTHGPGWAFPNLPMDRRGYIVGVGVSWNDGQQKGYWPIRHETGPNMDPDLVFRWIRHYADSGDVTWVLHNGLYDRGWLRTEGVELKRCHDTMTAGALINEYRRSYKLDALLEEYFGRGKADEELMQALWAFNPRKKITSPQLKENIWKVPPSIVGPYGEGDAADCVALWNHMVPILQEQELGRVYSLEMDLHAVLLAMRTHGIRVGFDEAEQASRMLRDKEIVAQKQLDDFAGYHMDVWSADTIAPALRAAGIKIPLTPKTKKPSVTADWLEALKNPMADAIKKVRKYSKMKTTFVDGYFLNKAINGRVHPEFKPLPMGDEGGAISGRMSSSKPNFQNLPNLDKDYEMGKLIRGLALPDEGCQWASCDYSQQEPRLTVHYAAICKFKSAKKAVQAYRENPATDFHQMVADITGKPRPESKVMNLALIYGRGGASTCHALGLPTRWITRNEKPLEIAGEEGQAIIDQYFEKMPFIKDLSDECKRRAKNNGYITTIGGRRCRFEQKGKLETAHYGYTYKALNALIQGSAADQTKMAMVEYYKEFGHGPLVQVHDELDVNDPGDGSIKRVKEIMLNVITLEVPMMVDIATGNSWGEAK